MSCTCTRTTLTCSNVDTALRAQTPKTRFRVRAWSPMFNSAHCGNHFLRNQLGRALQWACLPPHATSLQLPLLPFNKNEVLVPSETKTLHLYEARYLALLEESLLRKKLFVHFVLDPILISSSGTEASFAARYGCLVNIESLERMDVGALVSIRGISRVKIVTLMQSDPYLKGEVIPMHDMVLGSERKINSKVMALKEALYRLNSLEIKQKAPKEALLQTRITNSLTWAENEPMSLEDNEAFIPSLEERVSFAALQPITGATQSEIYNLQQQRLRAMDMKDTVQRVEESLELVNENISIVAAKLAIQSLGIQ